LRIAVRIDDAVLASRLQAMLADIPDLTLVGPNEVADVEIIATVPQHAPQLSPREQDVLVLMAEGASNRQIAERLGISVHTAKFHVRRITDKLDAVGRTDAVAMALQKRIIDV
jgi:DNA-binding CsgD family transcriptional regulator